MTWIKVLEGTVDTGRSQHTAGTDTAQFECDKEMAKELVARGITQYVDMPEQDQDIDENSQNQDMDNDRLAALVKAIEKLDAGNTELWTKSGAPKTEALADILNDDVSANERDAAWDVFQKGK